MRLLLWCRVLPASYTQIKCDLQRKICVRVCVWGRRGAVLLPAANDVIMLKTNATTKPV